MRIITVIALAVTLAALCTSCPKVTGALMNIPAKVTGQVMDQNGHGRGYVSVVLVPSDGGESIMDNAEDSGNFFIDNVPPGKYTMHVKIVGGTELPLSDSKEFYVGPGKTVTMNVTLAPDQGNNAGTSSTGNNGASY